MRYLFIVNPLAGVGGKRKFPELIYNTFRNNPADIKVLFTRCSGDAKVIIKEYLNDFDVFVAVGGDGTTNEVASMNWMLSLFNFPFSSFFKILYLPLSSFTI